MKKFTLAICLLAMFVFLGFSGNGFAQSLISGDIAGTVTDPVGAVIPRATITITSASNGSVRTVTTDSTGGYRVQLLSPGDYTLSVSAPGFSTTTSKATVTIGQIATADLKLSVGASSTSVEVSATGQGVLDTENSNLSTSFTLEQLQSVPNPGGDITYAAQTAPGVVMNTGGGYGNFSAFGLPGTSNNFTMNGMQVNDPFLNLNNSGPSNLLLGLNDVAEVNIVTNAYDANFGSFAGAQVNATSRQGGNQFHGNVRYWWNGRVLDANNWFLNNSGVGRPFANSNQWAAAVGGPIIHDKTFFFVNYEGLSFITSNPSLVYLPTPAYEAGVIGSNGACNNNTSSLFNAGNGSECAFYKQIFGIYNGVPNYSKAVAGPSTGELQLQTPAKVKLTEQLLNARIDQVLGANDKAFLHFKYDKGTQPTYNDPFNPALNITSVQPDWEGQISETHTFGTRAVNQLLLTGSYYSAIFDAPNQATANAVLPITLNFGDIDGFFSDLNPDGYVFPQGRNVTQYQVGDDFSYSAGKNTFKVGAAFKKDDVSDHDTGEVTVPLMLTDDVLGDFQSGYVYEGIQNFPQSLNLPLSLYTLGLYVQDDYKVMPNLTVSLGMRVERNSNPSCSKNCLSNFGQSFSSLAGNAALAGSGAAYNKQIIAGQNKAFLSYQRAEFEPRFGFNWGVTDKFVIRGGFGIFTDVFPGTIADTELFNPPQTPQFTIYGPNAGGVATLAPGGAHSVTTLAAADNVTFQTGFPTGGSAKSMSAANPYFTVPNFTTVSQQLNYPTYDEFNLQIQYAFSHTDSIQVGYVGNNGYHEPVQNENENAYGDIAPFPSFAAGPPLPSFGTVTQIQSNAISNYSGLIASYLHKGHGLTTQLNYTYSHNLDEVSNGGILPFSGSSISYEVLPNNLRAQYGNSDYDTRHYLNGNLLYEMPYFGGPKILTGGWEFSGTIFLHTGLPFTVTEPLYDDVLNAGGSAVAVSTVKGANVNHHCTGAVNTVGTNKPCLLPSQFNTLTSVGVGGTATALSLTDRNQFTGPGYFDTDITVQKAFHLPLSEATQLKLGVTAYNLLNHPNFANPTSDVSNPAFGLESSTVSPPTSIYGAFLGGDASVRIIQLTGRIDF